MSDDDGLVCEAFSHSFLEHSTSYIVGYKCQSTLLFIGIVIAGTSFSLSLSVTHSLSLCTA